MVKARRTVSQLASPRLAAVLLLILGVWSFLGTLVPQGASDDAKVRAWALANPSLERLVSLVGFHQTFSSAAFALVVMVLAASTAVCSWGRTKVALRRNGLLSRITDDEARRLASTPTFTVDVPSGHGEPVAAAGGALRHMGLRVTERDGVAIARSRPWVVFGSPVFHWALLLLILVVLGGRLGRAEGLIGVPVGDSRPLAEKSYGRLDRGALHAFRTPPLLIRVDKLDIEHMVDGIDRGPAPTVSIVGPGGGVVASQVVYPNHPLRYKSLTVHSSVIGLSPEFVIASPGGRTGASTNVIVDFAESAPTGTSAATFDLTTSDPGQSIAASVSVPLEKRDGRFIQAVPDPARATFALQPAGGGPRVTETLIPGQELPLPNGSRLRLVGVGYYARLSVVDDPSIPLVYALLIVALIGVSVSILGRQSLAVVVSREREGGGARVDVWFRDWRSNVARTAQAEAAIRAAVSSGADGPAVQRQKGTGVE